METRRKSLPRFSDRLSLGETKLQVSPFCLGLVYTEDAIPAAFDAGINFFFLTADMHWPMYEQVRRGLAKLFARGSGVRDQVVVAVTSYCTQPEFCLAPFQEVVASVPGLERIDVSVAGGSYASEILTRLLVYQNHKRQKFLGIQAIGSSFHDRNAARNAINGNLVDIAFIRYNPTHPGAQRDIFPFQNPASSTLVYNFKNVMGYLTEEEFRKLGLDEDYWQPSISDYYRFALTRPQIHGLLCAPGTPQEIQELAAALEQGPLDEEEENYLINLAELSSGRATLVKENPA